MQTFDIVRETKLEVTTRMRQVSSMFDVPIAEKSCFKLKAELDIPEEWEIGLIVGPSGCGKSILLNEVFGKPYHAKYTKHGVINDISKKSTVKEITEAFSSVGFNTIPAWLRPYSVLSNGEKFRVDMARAVLESKSDVIVIDEFTSVVDRQVAKIASHAVQKYVRKKSKKLVVASCHYDVIEWLQPDWIYEPATNNFRRRCLRRRPSINVEIQQVKISLWKYFSSFHYMTAELAKPAKCFALFVDDSPAAFTGILHFPHAKVKNIKRISRTVTHPDFQGLGLSFVLNDALGAAYKSRHFRLRNYPAHPSFIRSHARSESWRCVKRPGTYAKLNRRQKNSGRKIGSFGGRPNAVFEYVGPENSEIAKSLGMS